MRKPHIFCPGCEKNLPPQCFERGAVRCKICVKRDKKKKV